MPPPVLLVSTKCRLRRKPKAVYLTAEAVALPREWQNPGARSATGMLACFVVDPLWRNRRHLWIRTAEDFRF